MSLNNNAKVVTTVASCVLVLLLIIALHVEMIKILIPLKYFSQTPANANQVTSEIVIIIYAINVIRIAKIAMI